MTNIINDPSPVQMPTNLPFAKEKMNKELLRAAWAAGGIQPQYPVDTRTAFALLRIMGYGPDLRPKLTYHLQKGYFKKPQLIRGNFFWYEKDIIAFADSLHGTRNFLPMHPCHVHRLNPDELRPRPEQQSISTMRRIGETQPTCRGSRGRSWAGSYSCSLSGL